jgi:hypothetical protein
MRIIPALDQIGSGDLAKLVCGFPEIVDTNRFVSD